MVCAALGDRAGRLLGLHHQLRHGCATVPPLTPGRPSCWWRCIARARLASMAACSSCSSRECSACRAAGKLCPASTPRTPPLPAEGNLHGILVGREVLPDGILYASRETHYSVFKAGRMYRMDAVKVGPRRGRGPAGASTSLQGVARQREAGQRGPAGRGPARRRYPKRCVVLTLPPPPPSLPFLRLAPWRRARLTTRSCGGT